MCDRSLEGTCERILLGSPCFMKGRTLGACYLHRTSSRGSWEELPGEMHRVPLSIWIHHPSTQNPNLLLLRRGGIFLVEAPQADCFLSFLGNLWYQLVDIFICFPHDFKCWDWKNLLEWWHLGFRNGPSPFSQLKLSHAHDGIKSHMSWCKIWFCLSSGNWSATLACF